MTPLQKGQLPPTNPSPPFDILRTARAELLVTDLAASRRFYVDLLGLVVTEETSDALYLRCYEDRLHHCLVLRRAKTAAVASLGFRVRSAEDLERAERYYDALGCALRWRDREREGGGRCLHVQNPDGFPIELFADAARADRMLQRFDLHGGARPQRIDHFNLMVPDVDRALPAYLDLGFRCSEYISTDPPDERLLGAWIFRKPDVHDISFTTSHGPRLHHIGFWVPDPLCILQACDGLAAAGHADGIERGPGRHGVSNAYFVYLRDPDGHRIELTTPDYFTGDPDLEPIRWSVNDPRRRTFWGHHVPDSWYLEGSDVLDLDGEKVTLEEPTLSERPVTVT